jgi:hypothetical protein
MRIARKYTEELETDTFNLIRRGDRTLAQIPQTLA